MEKFTKKLPINKLKENDVVCDIFVVKIKKSIIPYKDNTCYSFSLVLSDSSGASIEYKYWGGQDENKVNSLFLPIKQDSVLFITGRVGSYRDKLQIISNESNQVKVLKEEEYEGDFIIPAKKDVEEMWASLIVKINSISNEGMKKLLLDIFESDLKDKLKKHPAAISIHHNWRGGLLQHTLEVVEYCEVAIKLNSELDRDLLISGALLHDIGKLDEMEVTSRIKGTRKGQFIGHLALGLIFISEKLKSSEIDIVLQEKLLHLLASHHGKLEFGCTKEPMIPEAVALYYSDELSSKVCEMIELIKRNKETTEDDFAYDYKVGKNVFLR